MDNRKTKTSRSINNLRVSSSTSSVIHNPSFSDDILFNILSWLPGKVLQQFKLVSKHWLSLIKDPHFVNFHFSRSKLRPDGMALVIHPTVVLEKDDDKPILFKTDLFRGGKIIPVRNLDLGTGPPSRHDFRMLKPVNGLVCLQSDCLSEGGSVLICNPCTGESSSWIEGTPTSSLLVGENLDEVDAEMESYKLFAFGFDPICKKHKVVSIAEVFKRKKCVRWVCEVLTVGENTWRKIDEVPPPFYLTEEFLHVNGVIYWPALNLEKYFRPKNIVAFDITSEKFKVIETPGYYQVGMTQAVDLVEVDGCLALLDMVLVSNELFIRKFNDNSGCPNTTNKVRSDDSDNWMGEKIESLPFSWNRYACLSFQAIAGTDLIVM